MLQSDKPKYRYSYGYEWKNTRGQVFVFLPGNPMARRDHFVPRSKLVMAELIGRPLTTEERVYHINEQVDDDEPSNLKLFENQQALAKYRSDLYHDRVKTTNNYMKLLQKAREERSRDPRPSRSKSKRAGSASTKPG